MNMFKDSGAASVADYLAQVPAERQELMAAVHQAITEAIPALNPRMVSGMIGYGTYNYTSKSGRTGDWSLVMLSNRKDYVSVYICVAKNGQYLAEANRQRLGKVSVGKSCIRFKKLEDINLEVLSQLCVEAEQAGDAGDFSLS